MIAYEILVADMDTIAYTSIALPRQSLWLSLTSGGE